MKKEYIYQASIIEAETNEVIAKISSFSQESLLETMGKSKWTEAVSKYEEKLEAEIEQDKLDAEEEGILPGDLEEAMDAELQIDADADKKLEEGLVHEEDLEKENQ